MTIGIVAPLYLQIGPNAGKDAWLTAGWVATLSLGWSEQQKLSEPQVKAPPCVPVCKLMPPLLGDFCGVMPPPDLQGHAATSERDVTVV